MLASCKRFNELRRLRTCVYPTVRSVFIVVPFVWTAAAHRTDQSTSSPVNIITALRRKVRFLSMPLLSCAHGT